MLKKIKSNKIKKVIFLLFGNKRRFATLGNFAKSNIYGNILLICLSGRFGSIIGRILYYFKIGNYISIDANPFLKDKKNSINIWFNGVWKIFKEFKDYDNNFVNIYNPVIKEEQKVFQIYPLIYKKKTFYKKPKIIFMGKIYYKQNENLIDPDFLYSNKEKLLNQFDLIDNKNFWSDTKDNQKIDVLFKRYRIMKTYLREQIILNISKNFKKNFVIYGEDKKNIGLNFLSSQYDKKEIKRIYEGNICIDTGPIPGSLSLHPRSIQILESNGLLMQVKQNDFLEVWGDLNEKIIFSNIENLLIGIDLMLTDQEKYNEYLSLIYEKFKNSDYKIYETLKKAFPAREKN